MIWQDWTFAVGGFIFAVALLPTVRDRRARVPAKTSVPTAAVLTAYVVTQASLGLWLGAGVGVLTAAAWWFIAAFRRGGTGRILHGDDTPIKNPQAVVDARVWRKL